MEHRNLGRVIWFAKRFGWKELIRKPLRTMAAPLALKLLGKRQFVYQGQALDYLWHQYNTTWVNERCVEVPIANRYLSQYRPLDVLEVGNVLSHYQKTHHLVVDLVEKYCVNVDINHYYTTDKFKLVLCISTLEHVGFDYESEFNLKQTIYRMRYLLAPGGKLVLTVPVGYNPAADDLSLYRHALKHTVMVRTHLNHWMESEEIKSQAKFGTPFPYANAVRVVVFETLP